jgi:hypothetical protein
LSRFLLDAMLADIASAERSDVRLGRRVEGISGDLGEGFSVAVEGEDRPIAARAVLAAWGRWSPLDLDLGRTFAARRYGRFFGWSRHDRGDSSQPGRPRPPLLLPRRLRGLPGWRTEP